jgi:hypothetical protein
MQLVIAVSIFTVFGSAVAEARATRTQSPSLAGTYSNLSYNEEGGDLLGLELKIVPWGERYRAAVLVSEGSPSRMVVVDVRVKDRVVSFEVPPSGPDADDGFSFRGTQGKQNLTGTITYASGSKERVTLTRQCGYWDR